MPRNDLKIADLTPGDLVLWKMGEEASHVEMFTGGSHFSDTSIHAVNTPAKQMTRVMATSFTPQFFKHVFHCMDNPLRTAAVTQAQNWAQYENRYDTDRIAVKTAFREMHKKLATAAGDVRRLMVDLFYERGRFRAIKYASRRNGVLCYPGDQDNNGKGMTCCMFAILSYQVAGIAPQVKALGGASSFFHVSDKKMGPKEAPIARKMLEQSGFSSADIQAYFAYLGCIQAQNEYSIDWAKAGKPEVRKGEPAKKLPGYTYVPSLLQWNNPGSFGGFDWGAAITPAMLLDAKIANPEHLWQSLVQHDRNWTYLGSMADDTRPKPSEAAVQTYKTQVDQTKNAATQLRSQFAPKQPTIVKPQ
jgi:hypothetical protein